MRGSTRRNESKPGSSKGRPASGLRRAWLLSVVVVIALVAGACSSSTKSGTTSTTAGGGGGGGTLPGNDVGITATQIHIAMISDVNTSFQPGLFQKNVNNVEAWAKGINANGGLAGRQIVVDFCDSKSDPNA